MILVYISYCFKSQYIFESRRLEGNNCPLFTLSHINTHYELYRIRLFSTDKNTTQCICFI